MRYIYRFTNKTNGKVYIGQTTNIRKRNWGHRYSARDPREMHRSFYKAVNEVGWENFEHEIIDTCETNKEAYELERAHIIKHRAYKEEHGYNMMGGGGARSYTEEEKAELSKRLSGSGNPMHGKKHSQKARERMSASHKGAKLSDEHKRKIADRMTGESNHFYGKRHSQETKDIMAAKAKGRVISEETRAKISKANSGPNNFWYGKTGAAHPSYGRPISEETRIKKSIASSGDKNGMYGKTHTTEAKQNMSKARKGKQTGSDNPMSKLTDAQTKTLRSDFDTGNYTFTDLSKKYDISAGQIRRILRNERRGNGEATKDVKAVRLKGERSPNASLTQSQANEIRTLWKTNNYTQKELAKMFDVSVITIGRVVRNKIYVK